MRTRRVGGFTVGILAATLWTGLVVAQGPESGVEFVDSQALEVEVGSEPKTVPVALLNRSASTTTVNLSAQLRDGDAGTDAVRLTSPASVTLEPSEVRWIELTFARNSGESELKGLLVAAAAGGQVAVRPITVQVPPDVPLLLASHRTVPTILAAAILFGLAVALFALWRSNAMAVLGDDLGPVEFDAKGSVGAVLTLGGGIVTAIAATKVLPDTPAVLPKGDLAGLSIGFALLLLLVPVWYRLTGRLVAVEGGFQEWGRVWSFLLAVGLLAFAVIGQLLTVIAFFADSLLADTSQLAVSVGSIGALLAAGVLAAYLSRWATWTVIKRKDPPPDQLELFSGPGIGAQAESRSGSLRTWSLP